METVMKWIKYIMYGVVLLFVVELIFGYTGTIIFIAGKPIRMVLFLASAVMLYGYSALYVIKNKLKIFNIKDKNSVLGSFKMFDWALVLFCISTAASLFIVPRFTGANLYYAKCEALDCLCMLLIAFPICFLIRKGEINFKKFESFLYWAVGAFSLYHIALYAGENMRGGFIRKYFDFLISVFGPNTQLPDIILGHRGYPRVMFITSIYIIVGMYLVLKRLPKLKWYDYLVLAVHVLAFLTTMTKSVWLGVIVGLAVFSVLYVIKYLRRRKFKEVAKYAGLVVGIVALVFILNYSVFNNMVVIRFKNAFAVTPGTSQSEGTEEDEMTKIDREGAAISNTIKIEQTEKLLGKWTEHPVVGNGYGSYVEDYVRSESSPFSYEMQFPALVMKTGIIGVGLLLFLIVAMLINMRKAKKNGGDTTASYAWIFLLVSFAVCVQTNPLLLNYNGMSLIVLLIATSSQIECDGIKARLLSGKAPEDNGINED